MQVIINGNPANILMVAKSGSGIQNLETVESDKDYNVLFNYVNPNSTLNAYPTDIQKGTELYNDLVGQLSSSYDLQGDVVFKEVVKYFTSKVSTENYDFLFVSEEYVMYSSPIFEYIRALSPALYEHDKLLNHLRRKVYSLKRSLDGSNTKLFRYMYYAQMYLQTTELGYYTPYILDESIASDIRDIKLGGKPRSNVDEYMDEVEKLHLGVPSDVEDNADVHKLKEQLLLYITRGFCNVKLRLPIESSLLAEDLGITLHESGVRLHINFSTHPRDSYIFERVDLSSISDMLKAKSFGRYFKQHIENKYTTRKNGELLTRRD